MAVPTWSQLTFLTAQQQTKMAQMAVEGAKVNVRGPLPDLTNITYSQVKGARQALRELHDLIGPTLRLINYATEFYQKKAVSDFDAANP
jgi:hypothetical protein